MSIRIFLEKRNVSVATVALIRTGLGVGAGNQAFEHKIATEYSELFFGLYPVSKSAFQFTVFFAIAPEMLMATNDFVGNLDLGSPNYSPIFFRFFGRKSLKKSMKKWVLNST